MSTDDDSRSLSERLEEIHDHLAACLERPVERTASRWIGEAAAVSRDLAEGEPSEAVVAKRLVHVRDLLDEVEGTGDEAASDHVEQARQSTVRVLADLQ